ncbi:MAG: VWA domain-containing protein [Gammaproteobacteria bacterium]|nr:VWA domain-containing protein [Gammaproteobacteria bacterium]
MSDWIQWIQELHFIRPWWLLGLVLVPVAYYLRRRIQLGTSSWESVVSAELLEVLIPKQASSRQYRIVDVVLAMAFALAFVALAGPSWEKLPQPVERKNDNLVLVWDLSYSMYVQDISPSRFVRSKQKITDILRNRQEGTTGMIAYAGDAHVVTPLTNDTNTIQHLVASLNPSMMPIPGSNTSDALMFATSLIEKGTSGTGRILLICDDIEDPRELANVDLGEAIVHILGVGTEDGGPIPIEGDFQFLRDENGNLINPSLDASKLKKYAQSTGGSFNQISLDDSDIASFFDDAWNSIADTSRVENREFDDWHDVGFWLLIPITILAIMGLRRGVVVVALLVVVPNVKADWKDDVWIPKDRQGYDSLKEGKSEEAEDLFKDPGWQAVAKYRSGKFEEAAQKFSESESLDSKYNLGNSLAKNGQIEEAISAYESVLNEDPAHEDALYNKELLEELLAQLEQMSEQQQQGESGAGEPRERNEQESGQSPEPNQQQSGQSEQSDSGEDVPSQSSQSVPQDTPEDESHTESDDEVTSEQPGEEQESTDGQVQSNSERESEDAFDRWIRRIPDNPGSLLYTKFRHESSQRIREGEIKFNASNPSW